MDSRDRGPPVGGSGDARDHASCLEIVGPAARSVALRRSSHDVSGYYRRVQHLSWIIVTGLLSIVGFSIATEALGLELLGGVNLTNILVLGADGPTHGFLAVGHLFAVFSVVGIGISQLRRWFRMRNTGVGMVGIAALTGCCGTTAIVLAPVFMAVLAVFGVHSDVSYIILAALLTTVLIAIAYAWTGERVASHHRATVSLSAHSPGSVSRDPHRTRAKRHL